MSHRQKQLFYTGHTVSGKGIAAEVQKVSGVIISIILLSCSQNSWVSEIFPASDQELCSYHLNPVSFGKERCHLCVVRRM